MSGLYIDGIASSQAIDTAGEVVSIAGMDITSLVGSVFNYEHKSDIPAQIVGKILFAKKIFEEGDCENDRQLKCWNSCKMPFLYVLGQLFDDYSPSAQEIAGVFRYDSDNQDKPPTLGFSIEGSKIAKEGMIVTRSIARKVTITVAPANKQCLAEAVQQEEKPQDDLSSIFKSEYTVDMLKAEEAAAILGIPMNKSEDTYKKGSVIGKTTSGKEVWSHGPVHASGFDAQEHQEASKMHFQAANSQKGDANAAQNHYNKYQIHNQAFTSAMGRKDRVADEKPAAPSTKVQADSPPQSRYGTLFDPERSGKIKPPGPIKKAMTADSGNVAPGNLTQGAALAKPANVGKMKKALTRDQYGPTATTGHEKGVHTGTEFRETDKSQAGSSDAGEFNRLARSPQFKGKGWDKMAVTEHKKKLGELKAMPKPNLTKEEKGVNAPHKGHSQFPNEKTKGVSRAGAFVRQGDETSIETAKRTHKKTLHALQAMPKPNLTKAAKEYEEQKYPHSAKVRVHFKDNGDTWHMDDEIKGLNHGHAMRRAKENWPSAHKIESLDRPKLTKAEALERAEKVYRNWTKRSEFEKFMADRMPKLTKGEIIALGQAVALKKSNDHSRLLAEMDHAKTVADGLHAKSKEMGHTGSNHSYSVKGKGVCGAGFKDKDSADKFAAHAKAHPHVHSVKQSEGHGHHFVDVNIKTLAELKAVGLKKSLDEALEKKEAPTLSPHPIGHTRSGKLVHSNFDHEAHKDFSHVDHLDAAELHGDRFRAKYKSAAQDEQNHQNQQGLRPVRTGLKAKAKASRAHGDLHAQEGKKHYNAAAALKPFHSESYSAGHRTMDYKDGTNESVPTLAKLNEK